MKHAPKERTAEQLKKLFKLSSIEELKGRLGERGNNIGPLFRNGWWDPPIQPSARGGAPERKRTLLKGEIRRRRLS